MAGPAITRTHRALIGVVAAGAFIIAGIGFTGSYAAVRELALHKGFGNFSYVFPIGVDVGIAVLLALDLVLTWLRIPFPLLRQTAWLLTAGTIVFNAASSWGDPLAMAMHAIIPVLFVVVVEAARHAIGRIADISADRHMESVRLMRWLLSPVPTFRLWRRMKLWELRSYDEVVRLEQNRLVYRTHLRARYGRGWRRQAPIETLLPLKLAKYGVPLDLDVIRNAPLPGAEQVAQAQPAPQLAPAAQDTSAPFPAQSAQPAPAPVQQPMPGPVQYLDEPPLARPFAPAGPGAPAAPQSVLGFRPVPRSRPVPDPDPVAVLTKLAAARHRLPVEPEPVEAEPVQDDEGPEVWFATRNAPDPAVEPEHDADTADPLDAYLDGLLSYREAHGVDPDPHGLSEHLFTAHGLAAPSGDQPIGAEALRRHWPELQQRYAARFE
ncbi:MULTISPECIES: DUF2637 domain-containing protein [Streptacidiphilus]|uniref:DUF2637 domain-containing protein n=1 Tax=Streptacidiphilus cavernicola TaxID=3342716 RepID=A0ABV6UGD8_9ACTN|nr:DUF2637 domain-containing protein [Streptacidiphilus jeojiense]